MLDLTLLTAAMTAAWTKVRCTPPRTPLTAQSLLDNPPTDTPLIGRPLIERSLTDQPLIDSVPQASSTEGLFVAQLFRGDLTPSQYQRAMACFAARHDDHQPPRVPGE